MSKARMLGVTYDDAAVAFGCNPETMRRHYLALNEVDITDRVMGRLHGSAAVEFGEMPIEDKKGLTANRCKSLLINAGGGTRTHTPSYGYWILNPVLTSLR